ncbi:hypothetical protein FQA39_LY04686 [Lamprigera yunnana]|nr:hypothetical protein FQA39_LY04686 [Lamprigera yunnana]
MEDDDFTDLLGFGNEVNTECIDNSQESINEELKTLQNQSAVEDKLKSAKNLIDCFMPVTSILVVENKILKHLVPTLKTIYTNILTEIEAITRRNEGLNEKLHLLKDNLHLCINTLEMLKDILINLYKYEQFDLWDIQSVPINFAEILFATFQHCRNSSDLYKGAGNMSEIVTMFKLSQEVHNKVLTLMKENINISDLTEEKVLLLQNFLQLLVKISRVLSYVNVKALIDNWHGYMDITKKFSHILNLYSYSIKATIECCSQEVTRKLRFLLKLDASDRKIVTSTFKLCNFFIKIVTRVCQLFLTDEREEWEDLFIFLLTIYNYYPSTLYSKGHPKQVISQLDLLIFNPVDNLIQILCSKPKFCEMINKNKETLLSSNNCLLLFTSIYKNSLSEPNKEFVQPYCSSEVFDIFFSALQIGHFEFWKLLLTSNDQTVYDTNVRNIAKLICLLPNEEYNRIECILFKNILTGSAWCSLLAIDVWVSILKNQSNLCYETVCNILNTFELILKEDCGNSPQLVFLKNLLQRLYRNLSEPHKKLLMDKYPLHANLYVWKVFGLQHFSNFNTIVYPVMLDKMNLFLNKRSTLEDFRILCDSLQVTSTFPVKFANEIVALWTFLCGNGVETSFYFSHIIRKLILATNNLLLGFNNGQLLLVLTHVLKLLDVKIDIKICINSTLTKLLKRPIRQAPEKDKIFINIFEILQKLLKDQNEIIKRNGLETFFQFNEMSDYSCVIQNMIKNDKQLQKVILEFNQNSYVNSRVLSWEEYFKLQANYKFTHQCPKFPDYKSGNSTNCSFDPKNEETDLVIKRIKLDVELFYNLLGKQDLAQDSIAQIMNIMNK